MSREQGCEIRSGEGTRQRGVAPGDVGERETATRDLGRPARFRACAPRLPPRDRTLAGGFLDGYPIPEQQ